MVGEIFQEILSSLSLAAIVVCMVTTIFVLFPYCDAVGKSGISKLNTDSADEEVLCERKHGNFRVVRDIGKGRIIRLSGLKLLSKVDDPEEEELKSEILDRVNAAGDDNEVFSGVFQELKGERERVGGVQGVREKVLHECSERPTLSSEIKEEQERPVAETPLRYNLGDECGVPEAKREEVSEVLESDQLNEEKASYDEEEGLLFDDWEGIERTELEKLFGAAVAFVGSKSNADRLGSNVRLQLYGLHKVATQGPCHESRPMSLKLSAHSKWNAWQRLGNMDRDMAMEQYMILLSKSIPEWEASSSNASSS